MGRAIEHIFTVHARKRFCERVLQLPKKTDLDIYEKQHRSALNLELKKRLQGAKLIQEKADSILMAGLKRKYGHKEYGFFVNGKVIFVGVKEDDLQVLPVIVTCYKTDGYMGWCFKGDL